MAMITLGVLIDLGLIDKDSTLVWLMPALAVIALIAVLGRKFGKQLPCKNIGVSSDNTKFGNSLLKMWIVVGALASALALWAISDIKGETFPWDIYVGFVVGWSIAIAGLLRSKKG